MTLPSQGDQRGPRLSQLGPTNLVERRVQDLRLVG